MVGWAGVLPMRFIGDFVSMGNELPILQVQRYSETRDWKAGVSSS